MSDENQNPEEEFNPAHNVGQDEFDKKIDTNFGSEDKKNSEAGAQGGLEGQEAAAADAGSESDDLEDRESRGAEWQNNTTEEDPIDRNSRISSFFRAKKNRGIIAFIIVCMAIMGIMFSLLSGALGIVNLKETVISKLAQRADNVMTHRMNRVMVKKMSQDFTTGCTIKVKCRYRGMSTLEVRKFNKRNIGNGVRVVTEPSIIPGRQKVVAIESYQPSSEVTIGKDGSVTGKTLKTYRASELKTAMKEVPQIGKAMITFYKPYVQYQSGKVARGMLKRVGVNLGKKKVTEGKGDTAAEKLNSQQNDLVDKSQGGGSQNATNTGNVSADEIPDDVDEEIQKRTDTLGEQASDPSQRPYTPSPGEPGYDPAFGSAGRTVEKQGGGLSPAAVANPLHFMMNYCTLRSLAKTANQVRKVEQVGKLIKFSMIFLTVADQLKAGDADGDTAETINVAMSILTTTDKNGLSGFDSAGYNWIERGAVRPGYGEDVTKFQNGGQAYGLLGGMVSATTSGFGPACKIANSSAVTVAAIAATVLSGGTAGAFAKVFQKGGATAAKTFIKNTVEEGVGKVIKRKIAQKVEGQTSAKLAWKAINNKFTKFGAVTTLFYFGTGPVMEVLARNGSNTTTKGLVGPDSGNAFISGVGAQNSKASQAQALEPITPAEAVDQDKGATKSTMARVKLEGVNQLDASNQYSFASRLAFALNPTLSKVDGVSSIGSGFNSLYSTAFGGFAQNAYAEDEAIKQYQYCQDEDYKSAKLDVATDPFCNPQYGFDMKIVSGSAYDPEKVVNYVYDNGLVDAEGEPTGEFSEFVKNCLENQASLGQNEEGKVLDECVSRDDKYRMMRMYCTDSSIDSDMTDQTVGNCATQDEETSDGDTSAAAGSGKWSGKTDLTEDMKEFLDELSKHTSYEPICTTSRGGEHSATSDHYSGNACDFGSVANEFGTNNAQPGVSVPRGDELAAAALIAAGVDPAEAKSKAKKGLTPGTDDVTATINGKTLRVQVIWKSADHYDHVHVGVKKQ